MTGKEFLWQYIMIDRQIRSVKLQLDSMVEITKFNTLSDYFQHDIDALSDKLKCLITRAAIIKENILDAIQKIDNNECREILVKRYLDQKSVAQISREMFMTRQGVYYHLGVGEKAISSLI